MHLKSERAERPGLPPPPKPVSESRGQSLPPKEGSASTAGVAPPGEKKQTRRPAACAATRVEGRSTSRGEPRSAAGCAAPTPSNRGKSGGCWDRAHRAMPLAIGRPVQGRIEAVHVVGAAAAVTEEQVTPAATAAAEIVVRVFRIHCQAAGRTCGSGYDRARLLSLQELPGPRERHLRRPMTRRQRSGTHLRLASWSRHYLRAKTSVEAQKWPERCRDRQLCRAGLLCGQEAIEHLPPPAARTPRRRRTRSRLSASRWCI